MNDRTDTHDLSETTLMTILPIWKLTSNKGKKSLSNHPPAALDAVRVGTIVWHRLSFSLSLRSHSRRNDTTAVTISSSGFYLISLYLPIMSPILFPGGWVTDRATRHASHIHTNLLTFRTSEDRNSRLEGDSSGEADRLIFLLLSTT